MRILITGSRNFDNFELMKYILNFFKEEKDYNPYIAKKSLFHSLRILMFGMFLLDNEYIKYNIANKYYKDIVLSENNDWLYFKNLYQPEYNKLKSEFRKLNRQI